MKIRAAWAHRIALAAAAGQPIRCRRTGRPILPGMAWDLGHAAGYDVALVGDNVHDLAPEIAGPNRSAGGRLRHQLAAPLAPSRVW